MSDTVAEQCRTHGITKGGYYKRRRRGFTHEQALTGDGIPAHAGWGNNVAPSRPIADRLAERLEQADGGCLVWTGNRDAKGYGRLRRSGANGEYVGAHRAAWEVANGRIPSGMYVCHRCDNPPCCNPAHLFLGTPLDNVRDCVEKGRRVARGPAVSWPAKRAQWEAEEGVTLDVRV